LNPQGAIVHIEIIEGYVDRVEWPASCQTTGISFPAMPPRSSPSSHFVPATAPAFRGEVMKFHASPWSQKVAETLAAQCLLRNYVMLREALLAWPESN
jgi:hypothetical protein